MADDAVAVAMQQVDRRNFLRPDQQKYTDRDEPLPIGGGQTNSQPRTVAAMLRLLETEPGHRVLDVGAGSGWTTALIATLVGPTGSVIGVELDPDLAAWGAENLGRLQLSWASLRAAEPGVLGVPEEGPYDRILVSADAKAIPDALIKQLRPDGVMVLVVRSTMLRVRMNDGEPSVTRHGSYRFVPLRHSP
jgi:protein-L-isoaspartate(D-aspartate) O-methyltransferase